MRTGPTRRRWTGWPSWAAASTGCRRCCSSPTAATRWDRVTRSAGCWRRCPARSSVGCRSSRCPQDCVDEQARRAGRDGESVYQLAGGNPLLVTELLKAESRPVPGAVQDLILDRIRALPPPARDLAQLVAVVPTRADHPLISDAAEQVDLCIAAGVLVPGGRRRVVSARAAAQRGGGLPVADAPRRAAPAGAAGPGRACRTPIPGGWSTMPGWPATTRRCCATDRSRAAPPPDRVPIGRRPGTTGRPRRTPSALPEPEHAELLERYADEAHLAGANEEALQARERALVDSGTAGSGGSGPPRTCDGYRSWPGGPVGSTQMREAADRALEVLAGLPPSKALAMAYVAQAQLRFRVNDLAESAAWADRAVDLAEQLGEGEIALHASVTRDTARLAAGDLAAWASLEADPPVRPGGRPGRSRGPGAGQPGHRRRRRARPVRRGRGAGRAVARLQRGAQPRRALPADPGGAGQGPAGARRLGRRAGRRGVRAGPRRGDRAQRGAGAGRSRADPGGAGRAGGRSPPRPGGAGRRGGRRREHAGPGRRRAVGVLPVGGRRRPRPAGGAAGAGAGRSGWRSALRRRPARVAVVAGGGHRRTAAHRWPSRTS